MEKLANFFRRIISWALDKQMSVAWSKSFIGTLKCEVLRRGSFQTRNEAHIELFDLGRKHFSLGYLSPVQFEEQFKKQNNKKTNCWSHSLWRLTYPLVKSGILIFF